MSKTGPSAPSAKRRRSSGAGRGAGPAVPPSAGGWRTPRGKPVSCLEKLKTLDANIEEIAEMCQDAFEDAILMGCDEEQLRGVLHGVVAELRNPYPKKTVKK